MEHARKAGGSGSRSPSLSRRPSLKEKSAGISKPRKKPAVGVKKERWLLTRKTWRYMTDAVGNLLPEHHTGGGSKGGSGAGSRRSSATTTPTSPPPIGQGPSTASGSKVGVSDSRREGQEENVEYFSSSGGHGAGHGTRHAGGHTSYPRSVSHDGRSGIPISADAFPALASGAAADPSRRQFVARSSICGGTGDPEDPALAASIPRLEQNFEAACNKEKKFLLWTRTRPKSMSGPALRDQKLKEKAAKAAEGRECSSPAHHSRDPPPGTLDYYSPEEDAMDDDYDEYGEEQLTVKEAQARRKSSAASSILSLVSGGLSFFRPSRGGATEPTPPQNPAFPRTNPVTGLLRYFRHAGIQTDPFPEEILIRLRLQSVQEEQLLQQHIIHGRRGAELPLEEQAGELHHVSLSEGTAGGQLGSTETRTDPFNVQLSSGRGRGRDEGPDGEAGSSDIGGGGTSKSPSSPEPPSGDTTDKKSEESGYSSSISDTVMRYLRMARKNSKADNKETIDKFKTVNYDRSLRYIKSKNVTVEEALEHEKNKALLAQQKLDAAAGLTVEPVPTTGVTSTPPNTASNSPPTQTKPIPPSTLALSSSASQPTTVTPAKAKVTKVKKTTGKTTKSKKAAVSSPAESTPSTAVTSPSQENPPGAGFGDPVTFGGPTSPAPSSPTSPTAEASPEMTSTVLPQSPTFPCGEEPTAAAQTPAPVLVAALAPPPAAPPPASIGIQAGESLIRFLRHFNPGRKLSDFSSATSYGSSESPPVEVGSPRLSISNTVLSSASEQELFAQALMYPHPSGPVPSCHGTGTGRSSRVDSSASYSGADSGEYEEQFFGGGGKGHSNTSLKSTGSVAGPPGGATATTATMILRKSSSSQGIQTIHAHLPGSRVSGRDPSPSTTLYLHHILPATSTSTSMGRGASGSGLGGGLSSLSVASTPSGMTSTPSVSVSTCLHSGSTPYIPTSKGSPSPSASSTRSDFPQYTPRPVHTTPIPAPSTSRSGFSFLSGFRSSTRRRGSKPSATATSTGDSKPSSSSAGSISSFLRRTSSGSTKGQGQGGSMTLGPSVSFKGAGISGEGGVASSSDPTSSSSLVMQKSKSSSSVLHHFGSAGAAEKRGSTCSTTGGSGGGILGSQTAAAARGLMSKSRIFKSRSKSGTRAGATGGGSCTWTPQGGCRWSSVGGKQVTVEGTTVLHLSEAERATLQKVALAKLQALNLGVDVKIPREKTGAGTKPKRRPYLLKKKAMSTGFFDSGGRREDGKEGGGSGLVFGIPIAQCVANDATKRGSSTGIPSPGPLDWEAGAGGGAHRRSQNGSRNSVSSVCDPAMYNKGDLKAGSTESLVWGKRGSCAALDSLSCSSGDLLGENVAPVSSAVPTIVTSCIRHLETYGLHTTGIFRVSTSLKRIRQLREEIDGGKDVTFGEEQNPHDVAALLKEFLRDLPEPLLCRDLYQAFLRTQKIRNRRLQMEAVQHLIQLLPVPNRDTLAALLKFFAKVVENSADTRTRTGEVLLGNKMEGYSLATLIAPNILPCLPTEGNSPMDQTATQTKERRESIDVVNYMIANYKELFEVPAELLDEVYIHMMDTHPEVIEDILKQRGGGGDDAALDELETTSSVFEGSECGDPVEPDDPTMTCGVTSVRKFQKREELLHKDGGKGGHGHGEGSRRERSRCGSKDRDGEKQQSGAESDSSSTKSTSRWFRRGRTENKFRTSSDSGSEKVRVKSKGEPSLQEAKRASSLDSVNLKEAGSTQTPVIVTETVAERQRSCSDQSLKVPDNMSRRQSSPVLEGTGVITASLKIPVPLPVSIDDSDIPFIEDDAGGLESSRISSSQYQTTTTTRSGRARPSYPDGSTFVRTTPSSTHTNSPLNSPLRQPSSEVSSPATFSPPNSPPYDDSSTFPYEELTLRFCLGPPISTQGQGQGQGSTSSSNTGKGTTAILTSTSATVFQPTTSGNVNVSRSTDPGQESQEGDMNGAFYAGAETKGLGKETKGAKIAGLIKSKTADFEKFAKDSQVGGTGIASNMRLRSQGNIQLKQQFLLRQHDKFQQQNPNPVRSTRVRGYLSSSGVVLGPEGLVNPGSRSLQRRKNLAQSSSALVAPSDAQSSSQAQSQESPQRTATNQSKSTTAVTSGSQAVGGSPSRWKRSEIISSQHGVPPAPPPTERERFF